MPPPLHQQEISLVNNYIDPILVLSKCITRNFQSSSGMRTSLAAGIDKSESCKFESGPCQIEKFDSVQSDERRNINESLSLSSDEKKFSLKEKNVGLQS